MSRILIIDDNPSKYSLLLKKIDRSINLEQDIVVAACIRDGLKELQRYHFDLLILDMLLPEVPWSEPVEDGGVKLLEHLDEDPDLNLPKYIIGITASADHVEAVDAAFQSKPWVLLKTSNGTPWEDRLLALIRHVIDSEAAQDAARYNTDVCLITALRHPEFEALTRTQIHLDDPVLIDSATYVQTGTLISNGHTLSVVVGCCLRMGSTESALLASKLIDRFRPKIVGLAGICAGFEEKVAYGDVIIASPCWDYTMSSKITTTPEGVTTVANAPDFIGIEEDISARFENFSTDKTYLSNLLDYWPAEKPRNPPKIVVGPSATGPAVIADASVFTELRKTQHRETVGLEMEAYGVYCAVRKATRPKPIVFSAKGVCDYASFLKDDKYQKYAAYTSASIVSEFLIRHGSEICRAMD
jgi:nucleoside phosphorylase/CheY-like chemotaxis protein